MTLISEKIRVYTNGIEKDGVGAYAYIVLENRFKGWEAIVNANNPRPISPSLLRAKFAQAGNTNSEARMKMRAAYEGVRHCPDNSAIEIYSDDYLLQGRFENPKIGGENEDIASRYRQYIKDHHIDVTFLFAEAYHEDDFPDNDHDEWTWWAHSLCEDAIRKFNKKKK